MPITQINTNLRRRVELPQGREQLIKENYLLVDEGEEYDVQADRLVGVGGEAQVYVAIRKSDGVEVLAKWYDIYEGGQAAAKNRQSVRRFLKKFKESENSHILPLYASMEETFVIEDEEGNKSKCIYPIDIVPYCKEGTKRKCSYEELREKIIPSILKALGLMHESNLVHRDIKPENIYLHNGKYVVGDFGTASFVAVGGRGITNFKNGTIGYRAPEVNNGYVKISSDYFSLGCAIATLYKGEHIWATAVEKNNEGEFFGLLKEHGLPLETPEEERDLQILVDALTMLDEDKRAGFADVELWLCDSKAFCQKWKFVKQEDTFEYVFKDVVYKNKLELMSAFSDDWEKAKKAFYQGGVHNSSLQNLFVQTNQFFVDKSGDILEEQGKSKRGAFDDDLGLAKVLHFFNMNRETKKSWPLYWCGSIYNDFSDIATQMSNSTADKKIYIHMLNSEFLSWKMKEMTDDTDDGLRIKRIESIEKLSRSHPNLAYYMLMYTLMAESVSINSSADQLFKEIISSPEGFYKRITKVFVEEEELARLAIGKEQAVLEFKSNLSGNFLKDIEEFYRLFETFCKDKRAVRRHFFEYGPQSSYYWIQQNLHLYECNDENVCRNIFEPIRGIILSDEMSILELKENLISLKILCDGLLDNFQNDIIQFYLGLSGDRKISSQEMDAYFKVNFYDTKVPVGYIRYLGFEPDKGAWR